MDRLLLALSDDFLFALGFALALVDALRAVFSWAFAEPLPVL